MVKKRTSNCPLCGAQLSAIELLDACTELVDVQLGVLDGHCPHCQGQVQVLPAPGRVDIGYLCGPEPKRFELALSFPLEGLALERSGDGAQLRLKAAARTWVFDL